jgi:hypothetical protein
MRDADTAAYAYLPRMVIPAQVATDPGHGWVPVDPGPSGGGNTSSSGRTLLRPPMIPPPSPAAGLTDSAGGPVLTSDGLTRPDSGIGISPVDRPTENALGGPVPGSSWFVDTQRGKVLHTGGVIGVTSGQIGLGPSPASRPKPGDHPEAGRIDGTTESAGGLWGGGAGVGRSTDRRYQRRLPPETVWPLPRSVPQVLEPPPEREVIHDPGPGVIGIDR